MFCCCKRAISEIKVVWPQGLLGWRSVFEKRWSLSVHQPRFHVDPIRKVYSVSILNIYFDSIEELFITTTENFTGLDCDV